MKELKIELTLDENGFLTAETFGFKGKVCESELRELLSEEFVIDGVDYKDGYYERDEVEVTQALERARRKK